MKPNTTRQAPATLADAKAAMAAEMALYRQRILMDYPFTASVMLGLDLVPVRDIRLHTASTDGRKIYYDIAYWRDRPEIRRFVLAHETWHCILLHLFRRQNRELRLFNVAIDLETNGLLEKEGFDVPTGALMPDYSTREVSAEEIYEMLLSAPKNGAGKFIKGDLIDKHECGDDNASDAPPTPEEMSPPSDHFRPSDHPTIRPSDHPTIRPSDHQTIRPSDHRTIRPSEEMSPPIDQWGEIGFDPDYAPLVLGRSADAIRQSALSAAARIGRIKGTLPKHLESIVNHLAKGEIDWRERLAAFVTSAFGGSRRWLPPNRRHVHRGVYLQSTRHERLRAAVAIDTSGSTIPALPKFLGELEGLLRTFGDYEICVIQCDNEVRKVDIFDSDVPVSLSEYDLVGGGGTSFLPVFDHVAAEFEDAPSVLVYLTDGQGDAPSVPPPYPVLWLLTRDGKVPAPWGETAYFKEEE